ncbi:MAG: ABC transporter permease subunit, partial [Chloroflexi bacterium]|nr:ABC transporter permease subunit [Chloroflexota bacterium]
MGHEGKVPALEAFALTKTRRTTDSETPPSGSTWRAPDIVVQQGQFVTVLGQRAADVQFLLGLLSGLVESTSGVLRIEGQAVEDLSRAERARLRARRVGLLFRQPQLSPNLCVLDNILLPQRYSGIPRSEAEKRAHFLLERLGLAELASTKPADLTLMEGQLVALARALINRPAVLLADEPTQVLAPQEAERYVRVLRDLCRGEQVAVMLGTSNAELCESDHTVCLPAGQTEPALLTAESRSTSDLLSDLYQAEISPLLSPLTAMLDLVVRPLLYVGAVALLIVFLTFFGLTMAGAGRAGQTFDSGQALSSAFQQSTAYLADLLHGDLGGYNTQTMFFYWTRSERLISEAFRSTFGKSVGLLLISMALGGLIGAPLGLLGALLRHRRFSLLFVAIAIIGVSTPSFFLAFLLQILEVTFYKRTGVALLPVAGFGWDRHVVLPALVLAARPIAQVARISFVALSEILDADYIRTARAKGLITREILSRHALRNAGVPILAAMGASLGFSLSSLPIVESIFQWPGMGNLLLSAISTQQPRLAATLALALGILFVIVHVALDFLYRWIDPRLRQEKTSLAAKRSWLGLLTTGWSGLARMPDRLQGSLPWLGQKEKVTLPPMPTPNRVDGRSLEEQKLRDAHIKAERRRAWVGSTIGSLPFMLGGVILVFLLGMIVFGQHLAPHSPSTVFASLQLNGELRYAPFAPSALFPLGTDPQGRDILSLSLFGA